MVIRCRTRLFTVLFALTSLLFMQLAVASYVCPAAGSKIAEITAMAEAGMPCAGSMPLSMDVEQPNLCQAHCQTGQQSADKYEPPLPAALGTMPADFTLPVVILISLGAPLQASHLKRTTAPPLAVSNCCFRL